MYDVHCFLLGIKFTTTTTTMMDILEVVGNASQNIKRWNITVDSIVYL